MQRHIPPLSRRQPARPTDVGQVQLRLVFVDFWSIMKFAFVGSVALGILTVLGTLLVWNLLNQLGVFSGLDSTLSSIAGGTFKISDQLSLGQVLGFSVIVAILDVIVLSVLGAISAVLYNLSARITGGLTLRFRNPPSTPHP